MWFPLKTQPQSDPVKNSREKTLSQCESPLEAREKASGPLNQLEID